MGGGIVNSKSSTDNIFQEEEELFLKWSDGRPDFVKDGVVKKKHYESSELKLLFILKEVNDSGGGNWDLREFIKDGARSQTWDNITRWVMGIRAIPSEINWDTIENIDQDERKQILLSIAAMNLKKSPGGHTADNAVLAGYAEQDKLFIREQFNLYESDFAICCGTSKLFHSLIDFEGNVDWKRTKRGVWYHSYMPNKYIIEYSHPEARCSSNLLYYGLIDAIREIHSI